MRGLHRLFDYIVRIAGNRHYRGENPAIGAAYSPLRWSLLAMLALTFITVVFGAIIPIKSAAVTKGTIVVSSHKKTVQHLEGGIIRTILVADGDTVKHGQPLIELNDTTPQSNRNIARKELAMARITEARLTALKAESNTIAINDALAKQAAEHPDIGQALISQKDTFTTQRDAQRSKLATLQQRIEEAYEEIKGDKAQVTSANRQLELIAEEIAPMKRLVGKGYASRPQLLALQRHQQELEGNKGQQLASIAKIQQSITETQLQIDTVRSEYAKQISDEMSELQAKIADYEERLRATSDVMSRTVITSPYDGIVTGMKHHTVGAVITPGEALMDIVPQDEPMIIEAHVSPSDIDVVTDGLPCRISFSAYKTRSMPRLTGKISYVAADISTSAEQGQPAASFYKAKVEVDSHELARLTTAVKLYPGMPVDVFIETGSRSFLGYMLAPISSSMERAFKED